MGRNDNTRSCDTLYHGVIWWGHWVPNFHHRYLAMVTISTSFSPTLHMRFAGSLSFFVTQALIGWAWLTCPSHTCSGNYKGKYLAFGFYGGRRLPSFTKWEFLEYKKGILLFSFSVVSDSLQPSGLQHTRLPCPLPSPRVCSNSCPLSWWCHPIISSCVVPFS